MVVEGVVVSAGWEMRMKLVIQKLNEIVSSWTKRCSRNHRLPKRQISIASSTILTFGSYGIRVKSQNLAMMLCVLILSLLQWLRTFLLTWMRCLKGGLKYPIYIVSSQSKFGIDALCVDPFFTSMVKDIFGDLLEMLERRMGHEKEVYHSEEQIDCFIMDYEGMRDEKEACLHGLRGVHGIIDFQNARFLLLRPSY
ncbi:nuclear poly(A) polymerase 3 isoform X1 [Senna tora]|uniref:Nuclear poly(A) polymerase 3 isoform X1 n=1 Tax=Senna tora TaxID=362788 RepID=A0A834TGQ5_9FABA|nr:nuclear poly(A) polymerase 3 isoform X1 [Senna tora]